MVAGRFLRTKRSLQIRVARRIIPLGPLETFCPPPFHLLLPYSLPPLYSKSFDKGSFSFSLGRDPVRSVFGGVLPIRGIPLLLSSPLGETVFSDTTAGIYTGVLPDGPAQVSALPAILSIRCWFPSSPHLRGSSGHFHLGAMAPRKAGLAIGE